MRTDQPRQTGMDYWKGPHSRIISATPGLEEYRQIHLAEHNPGLWPATRGVETVIPADRRIDGVAEVTFGSVLSPLLGRKQTRLVYQDEVNVFRRTLLHAGPPNSARWYDVAGPGEKAGARALLYLRRRDGVPHADGPKMAPAELVTKVYDAVEADEYEVIGDELTAQVKAALSGPVEALYPELRDIRTPPAA